MVVNEKVNDLMIFFSQLKTIKSSKVNKNLKMKFFMLQKLNDNIIK